MVETSDNISFSMHEAWYSDSMIFLSMPVDSFDECSAGIIRLMSTSMSSNRDETLPSSAFTGFGFFILLGLLVGLMLSCRLIQGSAIPCAFPVGNHARR
jgi:hypothetical protein